MYQKGDLYTSHRRILDWGTIIVRPDSPFHNIGTVIGKRTKGRHITLQNLHKTLHFLTKPEHVKVLSKEEKLRLAYSYYGAIKETFPKEWLDYKGYRITHIVCLDALSIAGASLMAVCVSEENKNIDYTRITKSVKKLKKIDWSTEGSLKYLKGITGSKMLAPDLSALMVTNQ